MSKTFFQSKTMWLAILQAAVAVVVVFESYYPGVGVLLLLKSALDVIVRFYTTQPIGNTL